MEIVVKWGGNYLVTSKEDYNPKKEIIFFGETEICPGIKIKKIGEKKRSSFEMEEGHYLQYEGTLIIDEIKHCVFKSTWEDEEGQPLYRYIFAMPDTNKPLFLFQSSKSFRSGREIDCTIVKLMETE